MDDPQDQGAAGRAVNPGQLMSVIDSAMDAIITVDEAQRVVLFNRAAETIFGVPRSEAVGSSLERFIPARFREAHAEHVRGYANSGQTVRRMGHLGALSGLRADGSEFPIEASISQASVGGRTLLTVILRDTTDRRRLEEQFLHAQKMEVIGRLASGIAHDFNNLLGAIFNYLELASRKLDPEHPSVRAIGHAREAADRAALLTRQLLTFARKQPANPRVVSPRSIVAGMEPMLRRIVGERITLAIEGEGVGLVRADPVQLEQVVMNLIVNARDAMPEGGAITIEVIDAELSAAECAGLDGVGPGAFSGFSIADTGAGMAPEVLARLFEPFFTTKELGKGTGLGLSTCHGIIRRGGGHITVKSEPGKGTRVRAMLPRAAGDAAHAPARGQGTILVVEPSAALRAMIASDLEAAGYTVMAAEDGASAMALAAARRGTIDLLIADSAVPDVDGTIAALRGGSPGLRVLFIADGRQEPRSEHGDVLIGPFAGQSLLGRVRELVGK